MEEGEGRESEKLVPQISAFQISAFQLFSFSAFQLFSVSAFQRFSFQFSAFPV